MQLNHRQISLYRTTCHKACRCYACCFPVTTRKRSSPNRWRLRQRRWSGGSARRLWTKRVSAVLWTTAAADGTWTVLMRELEAPHRALRLAFNTGHQNALHAGLCHVSDLCDCCVSVDADLQDDLDIVPAMLRAS